MSVLPVWIHACLDPSAVKRTCRPRPWACDTSLEPSWQKKLTHEKKISLRMHGAPAARENPLCLLHKVPQNYCLELRTIKIS